jgi:hypothetical protein
VTELRRDLDVGPRQTQARETRLAVSGERANVWDAASDRESPGLRPYGLATGESTVPPDFDDPLPEDVLRAFGGLPE